MADGIPGKNNPFAASILKVLGRSQDVNVGLLYDEVLKLTRFNYKQTPQCAPLFGAGHEGGQYVFRLRASDQTTWEGCEKENTIQAYNQYLARFPHGQRAEEALARLQTLEDEQEWQKTERADRIYAYQKYLLSFPKPRYAEAARIRIAELMVEGSPPAGQPAEAAKTLFLPKPTSKSFTDPRDGQLYHTIELNSLRWMAENLSFDVGEGCWAYDDNPENIKKYGRLYTWEAALKACPPGWRLPTDEEWRILAMGFGGYYDLEQGISEGDPPKAYNALFDDGNSNFSALSGGYRNFNGIFYYLNDNGYYWCSTTHDANKAWYYMFDSFYNDLYRNTRSKTLGLSCRCVQNL